MSLPAPIIEAFTGRTFLGFSALVRVLGIDAKTLRRHVDAGDIQWRQKGTGSKRSHRVFTLADVTGFLERSGASQPCQSTSTGILRAGNTTSKLVVIASLDRLASQNQVRGKKRRRSKTGSRRKRGSRSTSSGALDANP